jgi:hypothetical protein
MNVRLAFVTAPAAEASQIEGERLVVAVDGIRRRAGGVTPARLPVRTRMGKERAAGRFRDDHACPSRSAS